MMYPVKRFCSSIVVQVTALTVAGLLLMLCGLILIMQTPVSHSLFPRTIKDNADSIAELIWLAESSPDELQPFILSAYQGNYRRAAFSDDFPVGAKPQQKLIEELSRADSDVAARLIERDIRFQSLSAFALKNRLKETGTAPMRVATALQIAVELKTGQVLNVWLAPALTMARQPVALAAGTIALVFFAIALGLATAAVTVRPIRRLEQDAARIELGDVGWSVSETGPREVRRVASALNDMRGRLTNLIREREQIVAAIAHDVRTGLTRIRLRMDEREAISADDLETDIAHMEKLISDMLAYARAESPLGPQELIKLAGFVADIAQQAPFDVSVPTPETDDFVIAGDPVALRRVFENLLENARRYGNGRIDIRMNLNGSGLEVRIEDDGPGLPPEQLETVFQAFHRGEASRNRDTGGTGLGLGIARAIARAHGASLVLENMNEGGLAAVVRFPGELRM